jgi:hypothetical protein
MAPLHVSPGQQLQVVSFAFQPRMVALAAVLLVGSVGQGAVLQNLKQAVWSDCFSLFQ